MNYQEKFLKALYDCKDPIALFGVGKMLDIAPLISGEGKTTHPKDFTVYCGEIISTYMQQSKSKKKEIYKLLSAANKEYDAILRQKDKKEKRNGTATKDTQERVQD